MSGREQEPRSEQKSENTYVKSARFLDDRSAYTSYSRVQAVLFSEECDLSAYRIRYKQVPHVVVLGQEPSREVDKKIYDLLRYGEQADLPKDIIATLTQRRQDARRIGPWVEGHYRPGRNV